MLMAAGIGAKPATLFMKQSAGAPETGGDIPDFSPQQDILIIGNDAL